MGLKFRKIKRKRFALDWIEGSEVIKIMINATTIATIVLPSYYPFCGTQMIKLISMSGYDNEEIKKFRVRIVWLIFIDKKLADLDFLNKSLKRFQNIIIFFLIKDRE